MAGGKKAGRKSRAEDDGNREGMRTAKVKVRYQETKLVRDMRENFEKEEKRAMRSSRAYRYADQLKTDNILYLYPSAEQSTLQLL